ncbi:MAG: hypothetical protein QXF25_02220 [Candidatus Pacearchaeota archaeon]
MADNLINRVLQMQQQGYTDDQIAMTLTAEGISPKEITDAINKSKIKAAVYAEPPPAGVPEATGLEAYPATPMPGTPIGPEAAPTGGAGYESYVPGMSSETVTEIAEQIVSEKLAEVTKSISNISVFKEKIEKQVSLLDERIKKVENIIEELRSAIIRKLGEFSQNVEDIKNEMSMMQDTFSKAIKPLAEKTKSERVQIGGREEKPEEKESFLEKRLKK